MFRAARFPLRLEIATAIAFGKDFLFTDFSLILKDKAQVFENFREEFSHMTSSLRISPATNSSEQLSNEIS